MLRALRCFATTVATPATLPTIATPRNRGAAFVQEHMSHSLARPKRTSSAVTVAEATRRGIHLAQINPQKQSIRSPCFTATRLLTGP